MDGQGRALGARADRREPDRRGRADIKRSPDDRQRVRRRHDIRTVYSAQTFFMAVADGSFGQLRCLNVPADCIKGIPGEQLLEKDITVATERSGYRRKFHPGERVRSARRRARLRRSSRPMPIPRFPPIAGRREAQLLRRQHGTRVRRRRRHGAPGRGRPCTPCTELKPPDSRRRRARNEAYRLFSAQLEREAAITRRALERVPEGKPDWKPHEKSMPLGYLAELVATMPAWIALEILQDELDLKPAARRRDRSPTRARGRAAEGLRRLRGESREALAGRPTST